MTDSFKVEQVAWDHPDACDLRQQQRIDIAALYQRVDSEPGTPPTADDITCFCVAYQNGKAVAAAAFVDSISTRQNLRECLSPNMLAAKVLPWPSLTFSNASH